MLINENLLANVGVRTAENEPQKEPGIPLFFLSRAEPSTHG